MATPTDRGGVAHTCNSGGYGHEDHWRDDHFDQAYEAITQRLEGNAGLRKKMAQQRSAENGNEHLAV